MAQPTGQPIRGVFTWLSGVLTPPPLWAIHQVLGSARKDFNLLTVPELIPLMEAWTLGQCGDAAFWNTLGAQALSDLSPAELSRQFNNLMRLNQETLDVLASLPKTYRQFLLCDLPGGPPRGVGALYPSDHILQLSQMGMPRLIPDIFERMARQTGFPLIECLFMDADPKRAVQTIRYRTSVEWVVNPWRLRRAFVLRRMLDQPAPSHVPAQSRF